MLLNLDPIKQVPGVCFSHKRDKEAQPSLKTINIAKTVTNQQIAKNIYDQFKTKKNPFNEHANTKKSKCNKSIGIMKKLSLTLSRNNLLTVYKREAASGSVL